MKHLANFLGQLGGGLIGAPIGGWLFIGEWIPPFTVMALGGALLIIAGLTLLIAISGEVE